MQEFPEMHALDNVTRTLGGRIRKYTFDSVDTPADHVLPKY